MDNATQQSRYGSRQEEDKKRPETGYDTVWIL
jgi:hypothetical protein